MVDTPEDSAAKLPTSEYLRRGCLPGPKTCSRRCLSPALPEYPLPGALVEMTGAPGSERGSLGSGASHHLVPPTLDTKSSRALTQPTHSRVRWPELMYLLTCYSVSAGPQSMSGLSACAMFRATLGIVSAGQVCAVIYTIMAIVMEQGHLAGPQHC